MKKDKKLEIKDISISFKNKKVLENVSIDLYENELVCILGVSGAGKTTLFNIVAGLLEPDGGNVEMDGENINGKCGEVSYMLQKDLLLPYKRIIDNVALPLVIKGKNKNKAREIAKPYFKDFGLEGAENLYPSKLSGGMRQRAALLRTYLFSSKVALLDEPFSALDAITKHKIHSWYLNIMNKIKMSTLFITHDIDEAILLSDRIYILAGSPGKIVAQINVELKNSQDKSYNNEEVIMSEKFIEYKREILKYL